MQIHETLSELFNLKLSTLIAGLGGAFVTMLRKNDGSLQARLIGYLVAVLTVLYVVPFLIWFLEYQFTIDLNLATENLIAFIFGMLSKNLTESFIDDPTGSIKKWWQNYRTFKREFFNQNTTQKVSEEKKDE